MKFIKNRTLCTTTAFLCALIIFMTGCSKNPSEETSDFSSIVTEVGGENDTNVNSDVTENNDVTSSDAGTPNDHSSKVEQNNNSDGKVNSSKTDAPNKNTLRGTTIQFATWEDVANTEYGPVINAFTKKTGIKVKIVRVTQSDYINKLSARIAASNSPDVFKENGEFPRMFPLARPITDGGINPADSFWDQRSVAMNTVNGKVYGVASKQEMFQARYLVYYNKKLFAEHGVATPEDYVTANNWTWDTLLKAATKIKSQAGLTTGAWFNSDAFSAAYGGSFIKYNNGKFNSGIEEKALSDVWSYMLQGKKNAVFELGATGSSQDFVDGKIGISINDTYGLKKNGYFSKMKDSDLGFTYLPKKTSSDSAYPSSGWIISFGLLKGSKNPEGAGEFLKYYLNMDNYDTSLTYKNSAAESFAKTICNIPIGNNMLNTSNGTDKAVKTAGYFRSQMLQLDPAQIQTGLNSMKNVVNNGVNVCNNLISQAGK